MNETLYDVSPEWARRAHVDAAAYQDMYAESMRDPDGFWREHGRRIDWFTPFTKVRNASFGGLGSGGEVSIRWFEDGVTNVAHNCIDRHLAARSDQVAIIWEGDDPGESRRITYRELHAEVCRMANVLRNRGVGRGDRVTIYMPMIPEAAYAMLARQGDLVPEPKTVAEHAHNARLHEARGDAVAARRSHHAAALLGQEQIDPHLRYAALLRAQDGRSAAREIYAELMRGKPARALALTHALQFEGAERRAKLEAFVKENPDFAPAHYLLAEEQGEDRAGAAQTIAGRRLEAEALGAFLKAESEGRLGAFFLDHAVLAAWLDKARKRRAALDAFFDSHPTTPTASFTRSNTGWTVAVTPPEAATAILYRVGETGEFRSTGMSQASDPRTGKPAPNPTFDLPKDQGATTLHLRYEDANSRPSSPVPIAFEPRQALLAAQRGALEAMPGTWVSLHAKPRPALSIAPLIRHRCALDKALVALDEGPLDNELPLPPCDEKDPFATPSNVKSLLTVPDETRAVSVQLFYADGTVSDVKTFNRE